MCQRVPLILMRICGLFIRVCLRLLNVNIHQPPFYNMHDIWNRCDLHDKVTTCDKVDVIVFQMVHHIHIVGLYTSCRLTVVENFKNYGFKNKKNAFHCSFFFVINHLSLERFCLRRILSQSLLLTPVKLNVSACVRFSKTFSYCIFLCISRVFGRRF